ncbi:hypothetical protein SAMN04488168_11065 [Bacillus sp. 491mf]|uniref:hypothetical protein n=1 Tax=Bacillus TaxID=1386 RepID=UPI00068AFDC4|nr:MULTISPECIES: hypothetical protein [unclassified Bacillus (in: firmicutes)]SFC83148.1 hypothetical protein SAMN04488168_11065 [Bacillus sp. 491mf]
MLSIVFTSTAPENNASALQEQEANRRWYQKIAIGAWGVMQGFIGFFQGAGNAIFENATGLKSSDDDELESNLTYQTGKLTGNVLSGALSIVEILGGYALVTGSNIGTVLLGGITGGAALPIALPANAVLTLAGAGVATHGGFVWSKTVQNGKDTLQKIQSSSSDGGSVKKVKETNKLDKGGHGTKGTDELKHPVLDNTRVGSALKDNFYHSFNDIIDNYAVDAQRFDLPNKKGHMDSLYQIEGSMVKYDTKYVKVKNNAPEVLQTKKTINGVFEWVVDPTTNKVTHRTFIPDGKVTGKINQWGR